MLDRKRGRRSRPDGARGGRGPGSRVLLAGALTVVAVVVGLLGAIGAFAGGGTPSATTERATEITRTEAVLQGVINPHSAETKCQFEYGTTEGVLNKTAACPFEPGHRSIKVPESANLSGLTPDMTYYYRIHASNENGFANGEEKSFTTLPHAPGANTEGAEEVKRSSATLTGIVHANGSEVEECYFEWGPEKEGNLPEIAPCAQTQFKGSSEPSEEVEATAHISGLAETHVYYYRLVVKNAYGERIGGRNKFESLPAPPHSNSEGGRQVTRTTATLWGYVRPNDSKVTACHFKYGPEGEVNKEAACESFGALSGEGREEVRAPVTGLHEGTHYSVYLITTNGIGTDESSPAGFETPPHGPNVQMHHARNITATSAELSASVNPHGAETECYFEYGTTPALGGVAPCEGSPGEGEELVKVGAKISGLTPGTTYLVRVVAFNENGSDRGGEGEKHNFTTDVGGQSPEVTKVKPKKGPAIGGTSVTIAGEHFESVKAVYFGPNEAASITKVEAGSENKAGKIVVVAPPGAGKVDITVETANGTSPITSKDVYEYGKPTLTGLSPSEGPAGTEVVATGSGFEIGPHGTEFVFGKVAATSVECTSTTECTVIVPPKAAKPKKAEVNVEAVVNHTGKSNKQKFKYTS
jgi:FlaG/FlaF family flagellin (archaellin)